MGAKTIQVSSDDITYYTLPGNTGEFQDQLGVLDDTIFGQSFKSNQPNLINWSVNANALYKGFAGYMVVIKKSGTPTTMTGEACSLVTGKTYKVTAATKQLLDRATAVVVKDNGVDHTADVDNIDYLFGRVTFKAPYTVIGPVTIDAKYLPLAEMAKYQKFTLTQSMDPINNSDMPTLHANSGHETFDFGLRTVGLELSGVYASANGYRASLIAREELVIEVCPDGGGKTVARGFFRPATRKQSGKVGALEEENAMFNLTVPDAPLLKTPFSWLLTSSDVSMAVQKCMDAFLNNTNLFVKYLPDGSTGLKGSTLVTDFSLQGGMDSMNEFSVNLQGSGQVTAI